MLCFVLVLSVVGGLCDTDNGGKAFRIPLNDGNSIPALGLGTFMGYDKNGQKIVVEHEVEHSVTWALDAGYRMIDTAAAYNTEEQVGAGVRASSVPRENIFILTKPDYIEYDILDYVDTWKGMEEAKKLGLAKSIGISNFNVSQIERLMDNCEIKPSVLEVEINLNLAQEELLSFCKSKGLIVIAFIPFGGLFGRDSNAPAPRANDPILMDIAKKYNKTTPQIVLRYLVQRGVVPIPKSVRQERIEENINVFDFELTEEEMKTLSKFNKGYRVSSMSSWQEHPYYPFRDYIV